MNEASDTREKTRNVQKFWMEKLKGRIHEGG